MIAGILLTVFVGLVVIGGIKRISKVSEVVVPFMAVLYVVLCLIIVFTNIKAVPGAFAEIISSAFNGSALAGGVMGSMIVAMQKGIARGIFSNDPVLVVPDRSRSSKNKRSGSSGTRFNDGNIY